MIKTEQAADGAYTLKSLASLNCCNKPAVFKNSEMNFVYFMCSNYIVNLISLKEWCWLRLPYKCYRPSGIFPKNLVRMVIQIIPEIQLKTRGLG